MYTLTVSKFGIILCIITNEEFNMETIDYFRQMPKIELHVHLESTIDGEKLENYAAKRGKRLPRPGNEMYNCSADDLSDFLLFLDFICGVAGSLEDLEEIAYDFSIRSGKENIIYAEAILNPTHWPQFNIEQIISALTAGFERGSKAGGCDCRFMLSLSRKQSLHEAMELVNVMKLHRTPRLLGLSIDGNEALSGRTGEKFAPAFLQAKQAGFGITVHAGESSGPEGVRDALDILHADRLDHGVRASEDSELITRLVQEQIALNICLTSNLTLLYRNPKEHPLRKLWEAGVRITLNRDDPTFLNLELTEELKRCAAFSDLSISDILQAQYNAVEAAFCDSEDKRLFRAILDDFSEKLSLHV
jgi:adenosine deaminase